MMARRQENFSWADEVEANIESGEGFVGTPVRAIHEYECKNACFERGDYEMDSEMPELSIGPPMILPFKAFTTLSVIHELEPLAIEGIDEFSDVEYVSHVGDTTERDHVPETANKPPAHDSHPITPPASPPNNPRPDLKEAKTTETHCDFAQKWQGLGSEWSPTPESADFCNARNVLSHCDCTNRTTVSSGGTKRIVVLMDWNAKSACCIDIYGRHWKHDFRWTGSPLDPKTYTGIADTVLETILTIVEQWPLRNSFQSTVPEPQHISLSFATKLKSGELWEGEEDGDVLDGIKWEKLRTASLHYGPKYEPKSALNL